MKIYRLHYRQELAVSIDEAWKFFSSPFHLNEITPAFFHVDILSPVPDDIYGGLLIEYSMKAVFGIPMTWLSEISHCEKPRRFVYIQRAGPFKFWSHEVCLTENTTGVILEDIVFYAMPLGFLGRMLNKILIARKLTEIFDTRRGKLALRWG
jgi:ligand-binding SRPBCC domain-containing protein